MAAQRRHRRRRPRYGRRILAAAVAAAAVALSGASSAFGAKIAEDSSMLAVENEHADFSVEEEAQEAKRAEMEAGLVRDEGGLAEESARLEEKPERVEAEPEATAPRDAGATDSTKVAEELRRAERAADDDLAELAKPEAKPGKIELRANRARLSAKEQAGIAEMQRMRSATEAQLTELEVEELRLAESVRPEETPGRVEGQGREARFAAEWKRRIDGIDRNRLADEVRLTELSAEKERPDAESEKLEEEAGSVDLANDEAKLAEETSSEMIPGGVERSETARGRGASSAAAAAPEPTTTSRGILLRGTTTARGGGDGVSFRRPPSFAEEEDRGSERRSDPLSKEDAPEAVVAGERVRDAIETLSVVGAAAAVTAGGTGYRLCHPSTDEFAAYGLPLCDDNDSASVSEPFGDGRLGGKDRSPVGAVPLSGADGSSSSPRMLTEEEETEERNEGGDDDRSYVYYVQNGIGALCCVCMGGLAAGLTMGLLSLDPLLLLIKIRAGETEEERTQAANLLPLVKQHHRLLVTLLLLNATVNEALPLFLDKVVPGYVAVVLSVTLVLFFGEIIPSALFTGPNQMAIASRLSPLVKFVMALLCPVAYPIAKLLDWVMHEEGDDHGGDLHVGSFYNRGELSALVRIQYEERLASKKRQKKEMAKLAAASSSAHHRPGYTLVTKPTKAAVAPSATGGDGGGGGGGGPHFGMTQYDIKCNQHAIRRELDRRNINYPSGALTAVSSSIRPDSTASDDDVKRSLRSDYQEGEGQGRAPSIHFDEVNMVEGALSMKTKMAVDVYTPLRQVFAVSRDRVLSEDLCVAIYSSGYSRIPIYVRDDEGRKRSKEEGGGGADVDEEEESEEEDISAICGLLLTRQLIVLNPDDERPVSTLPLQQPVCVPPNINLVDLINIFQTGGSASRGGHMALVCARPKPASDALERNDPIPKCAGVMGIVTLEDVIEELLQEEIYDEMDKLERISASRAEWAVRKWRIFVRKRKRKREREAQAKMTELATQATDSAAFAADAAEKAKDMAVKAADNGGSGVAPSDDVDPNFTSPLLSTAHGGTGGTESYGSSGLPEFT